MKLNSAGQAVVAPGQAAVAVTTAAVAALRSVRGSPPSVSADPGCEAPKPLTGGISVDADGTLFTVGTLDVTGVTIDLEDGETATDIELVPGFSTTGYVLTSKQTDHRVR
ncbi:MAG: hypothetical protein ACJZ57_03525 [Candidatus Poriferisodalaceae bacterium]